MKYHWQSKFIDPRFSNRWGIVGILLAIGIVLYSIYLFNAREKTPDSAGPPPVHIPQGN